MKKTVFLSIGLFLMTTGAFASGDHGPHGKLVAQAVTAPQPATAAQPAAAAAASAMTEGEVRKVDMENKKLTLKHGEIKNLEMPSMTMVFQVKDPAMLDKVKMGDKVRFTAEKLNGAFTVTNIEAAK
jgi:Cu(I)/Ag(I) efflux system protein CusF